MERASMPSDTARDVARRQIARWREMTPVDRAALADQLSIDVVTMASTGVRRVHPDISDEELAHELVRRRHGQALADAAWDRIDPA